MTSMAAVIDNGGGKRQHQAAINHMMAISDRRRCGGGGGGRWQSFGGSGRAALHTVPLGVPPPFWDRILVRGRHGRQHRGGEGEARTAEQPGAAPIHVLRVPLLRAHDRGAPRHGDIQRARPARARLPHGHLARVHRPPRISPRRNERRAGTVHGGSVSRDMEYGLQSGGVATHGIRVPVQCPSGGECGVEAIPEDYWFMSDQLNSLLIAVAGYNGLL